MDEELLPLTADYDTTLRLAVGRGLRALGYTANSAGIRLEQEESIVSLFHPKPHTMYWLLDKGTATVRQPICLVSQEGSPKQDGGQGYKMRVYYGRWAQYMFQPMQADELYRTVKPYPL